jgi:predicted nuclease with TOPRIM domain
MSIHILILAVLVVIMAGVIVRLIAEVRAANTKVRRFKQYWDEEREAYRQARDEVYELQDRYANLQDEYNQVAEIEEGEDYVRRSLGLPPEDQEESA